MIRLLGSGLISPPAIRLDGPRCYIRPPLPRDWREWADLRAASRDFLTPWEPTWPADALTRTAFSRRLRRQAQEWRDDLGYSFLIFDRGTDALVGGLGLTNIRRGVAQMGTLGYWAGQPYARNGYVSGGTRLVLEFAFGQLGLHRVEAACLPTNLPSRGLLEKVGFGHEGYARGYLRIDGAWRDHVLYAILREEWKG
ncbi:MAG: GNAT family N-acetyltransferase [Alphaproteobacteria bacterium]